MFGMPPPSTGTGTQPQNPMGSMFGLDPSQMERAMQMAQQMFGSQGVGGAQPGGGNMFPMMNNLFPQPGQQQQQQQQAPGINPFQAPGASAQSKLFFRESYT